jgi:hypothetical protein
MKVEHELHNRRFGRNLGLGLTLVAFVVLVLALTVVKVTRGMTGHEMDAPGLYGASVPDPEKVSP